MQSVQAENRLSVKEKPEPFIGMAFRDRISIPTTVFQRVFNFIRCDMKSKLKRFMTSRVVIVFLLIAVQLFLIFWSAIVLARYYYVYSVTNSLLTVVFLLYLMRSSHNGPYKLAWLAIAYAFPFFGVMLYLIFGGNRISGRRRKKMGFMNTVLDNSTALIEADPGEHGEAADAQTRLEAENEEAARQTRYIRAASFTPVWDNCETRYFESGEEMFPVLLEELKKAEHYIFLEYFIIGDGEMWEAVHQILLDKVKKGLDVRVIYDDVGCAVSVNRHFDKQLCAEGIDCRIFQRFVPFLTARQNNRDHRKICVIDGVASFTGGINLSDEYINTVTRFGYWKDTAVMIRGRASWSFTAMFLTMWDYLCGSKKDGAENYAEYLPAPDAYRDIRGSGFVQPYTDTPMDGEAVGENVYLGLIQQAKKYVWITTPYLIIDEIMERALLTAVRCGVDVRIVTPGIPDKKLINETTKNCYPRLIEVGVKIYEYTPGFVHAKGFLCDDTYAAVGSVNLDYRSLYLHFECGAWMYKTDCIPDIKRDFESMFAESRLLETPDKVSAVRRLSRGILNLIAPLF